MMIGLKVYLAQLGSTPLRATVIAEEISETENGWDWGVIILHFEDEKLNIHNTIFGRHREVYLHSFHECFINEA